VSAYASTSTPTFTLPSDISYVFLSMALAVLYSNANRHVHKIIQLYLIFLDFSKRKLSKNDKHWG